MDKQGDAAINTTTMKLLISAVAIAALLLFFGAGCYYDKKDLVYPPPASTCDTTGTTYSLTIVPILSASCYSCHSGSASSGGGIVLDNYNSMLPYINNGLLVRDIVQSSGANPMPKGGTKLDNCSINKIIAWINKGKPNN